MNEIDVNGKVVWLKSTEKLTHVDPNVMIPETNEELPLDETLIKEILKKDFAELFSEEDLLKFEKFLLKFVLK